MSRGLSPAELAAAAAPHRKRVALFELLFDTGTLRLAYAPWDITVGANTFTRAGPILEVSPRQESAGSTEGLDLRLSGLDAAIIAIANSEQYRGRVARMMKAFLDADTNQVIGTPKVAIVGRMSSMIVVDTSDAATVDLSIEHYDRELERPAPIRLNDPDQQRLYPGDLGCSRVEQMVEANIVWPAKEAFRR